MGYILVTGGAGYIGSKICFDLIDKGYKVIIIDNLSTGHRKLINKKSKFYKIDFGDRKSLLKIFAKHKIDSVIHLAASLSVEESMRNPAKYYLNNVVNTKNLLEIFGKFKIKKFIFSSTCAIFGEDIKVVNSNTIPNPSSHYGITKFMCESMIKNYSKKYNFMYFNLRYFNVVGADKKLRVGPINNSGQLFKNLASNIYKKKYSIKIFGKNYDTKDGTCIRDYIDINDLSKIHLNCLKNSVIKKSTSINCGYGTGYSVLEIVKKFEEIFGKKISIVYQKRRLGDLSEIICSPSKAKSLKSIYSNEYNLSKSVKNSLGWEFKYRFKT